MKPTVYLQCEFRARDLDARLLIAAHLLRQGFPVVIGQQWAIWNNVATLPPGVLLGTAGGTVQATAMAEFKRRGHMVIGMDEEGLALCSPKNIIFNIMPPYMETVDLMLANSQWHRDVIVDAYPAHVGKVRVTGSPRVSLLDMMTVGRAYEDDAAAIRSGKPFVLLNTNFTLDHYIWGDLDKMSPEQLAAAEIHADMLEWERGNKAAMLELIDLLVAEDVRVVVRPHPSERVGAWEAIEAKSILISVVHGTSPHEWLLAADLLVHTNCTTGIEAAILNRPQVNLSPAKSEWEDAFLCAQVCHTVRSAAEVMELFRAMDDVPAANITALRPVMGDLDGSGAASVADVIACLALEIKDPKPLEAFTRTERMDGARMKFQVLRSEMERRFTNLASAAEIPLDVGTRELDESLWMLVPNGP